MRSTTFPHELHAGGSPLFIASSPWNEAIHVPSRSIEMEIRFTRHQTAVHRNICCFLLAKPTQGVSCEASTNDTTYDMTLPERLTHGNLRFCTLVFCGGSALSVTAP